MMTDMMTRKRITRNLFMSPGSGGMKMSLNSLKIVIPLVVLTLLLQGCASIAFTLDSRENIVAENPSLWPIYTRSHWDLKMFYYPIWLFTPAQDEVEDRAGAAVFFVFFGAWMMIGFGSDIPISLVIDTLTLPRDIRAVRMSKGEEYVWPPDSDM